MDAAVAAMRAGAYDFITKPAELDALDLALSRAVQHRALREEVKRLRRVVADGDGSRDALGESPEMRSLHALVARVAPVDASVVVTGETGTGKEVVARLLHSQSTRSNGPFVAINCAALPAQLLESELFGHERGAFTDAKARRTGLFVQAHGGTIFLDEIGALPLELQPKLLRALEERVVRPVGGNAEVAFDARLVAATNEDLETAIEAGRFREDLYFRLNVIHIPLPPLRVRGNDVLLLAQQFIDRYASRLGKRVGGLTSAAAEKLLAYAWPGNVRELQNCIERAVALTQYESLTVDDLPEKVRSYESARLVVDLDHPGEFVPMAEIERRYVLRVLAAVSGNKAEAARILGLDRKTLYRKLERYGSGASVSE
jgi:two-component system response regulator HydG